MPRPAAAGTFEHLIGARLTIDMREVVVTRVECESRRSGEIQLSIAARERRTHEREYSLLVTCGKDRAPLWVLDELRQRELHSGYRYALGEGRR